MSNETFTVFLEGTFAGTAQSLIEAQTLAKQVANRMGKVGSVKYSIFDNQNNRRGGGTLYST